MLARPPLQLRLQQVSDHAWADVGFKKAMPSAVARQSLSLTWVAVQTSVAYGGTTLRLPTLLFVVDAADSARFEEAKALLVQATEHECLRGKPLLILANKQDLPPPGRPSEIAVAQSTASKSSHPRRMRTRRRSGATSLAAVSAMRQASFGTERWRRL